MINFTLKNIPKELHKKLKERAKLNRRSINSEIIATLEQTTQTKIVNVQEVLARTRALREKMNVHTTDEEINRFKREGRL